MSYPKRLLLANAAWANEISNRDPEFFPRLAKGQQPRILWIGCSDSRVSMESITNSRPGELFVHRNIANLYTSDDGSASSVVEYAVHVLKVEHIIICGHYDCGGVRAALTAPSDALPLVNRRIRDLRNLAMRNHEELDAIDDLPARANCLAELNVIEQVKRLSECQIVTSAPKRPHIHGWIFSIHDGLLKQIASTSPSE